MRRGKEQRYGGLLYTARQTNLGYYALLLRGAGACAPGGHATRRQAMPLPARKRGAAEQAAAQHTMMTAHQCSRKVALAEIWAPPCASCRAPQACGMRGAAGLSICSQASSRFPNLLARRVAAAPAPALLLAGLRLPGGSHSGSRSSVGTSQPSSTQQMSRNAMRWA